MDGLVTFVLFLRFSVAYWSLGFSLSQQINNKVIQKKPCATYMSGLFCRF